MQNILKVPKCYSSLTHLNSPLGCESAQITELLTGMVGGPVGLRSYSGKVPSQQ